MVSSFGITALESRKNKEIDFYSDYSKNKPEALTFAAITSVWISLQSWNLAYNVHHGLADKLDGFLLRRSQCSKRSQYQPQQKKIAVFFFQALW